MNVKAVVKVMNFHALLRVDKSRKLAEKYILLEHELSAMMDIIVNNRNFVLDKRVIKPSSRRPILNIYLGSDFGFCGSINSTVNSQLSKDHDCIKITIGKKLHKQEDVLMRFTREDFERQQDVISKLLEQAVYEGEFSKINLIYNHYHNLSTIEYVTKCIFPMDMKRDSDSKKYSGDFVVEGDISELLKKMMISYLMYEVKIAFVNSLASENITRQNATSQSLKKIDEREEDRERTERKVRNQKAFRKIIDSFMKKDLGGNRK